MDEMGSVRSEHVYELAKTHRKNIESISDAFAAQEVGDRSSRSTAEFRFKLAHRVQDFMSRFGTPPLDGIFVPILDMLLREGIRLMGTGI